LNTDARRLGFGLPLLVGLAAIVATFAGSASISDRSALARVAPVGAKALINVATSDPVARANATRSAAEDVALIALSKGGSARRKLDCAGCGVVESVRRIDRQEGIGGVCAYGYAYPDSFWVAGNVHDGGEYSGVATFLDTAAGTLAGQSSAGPIKVTTSYQFVVRLRDGSRHVFDQATRGTLHLGERILVIAGVNLPTDE
jgi:outer membrane lipoprotein SlyB